MVLFQEPVFNVQLNIVISVLLPLMFVIYVLMVSLNLLTVVLVTNVISVVLLVPLNVTVFNVSKTINLIPIVVVLLVKLGTVPLVMEKLNQKLPIQSNKLLLSLQTS